MSSRACGAILSGHPFDLQDCLESLPLPHDPWVEKWKIGETECFILRSNGFAQLQDNTAIWEAAKLLTIRINGALAAFRKAELLTIDGIAERQADGTTTKHIIFGVGSAHVRARAGAISPSPPAGPTLVQQWLDLANKNDLVEDLLMHLSVPPNWYDLYKAYEVIRGLSGGEKRLWARDWCPSDKTLSGFKHTANVYRHSLTHPSRQNPPSNPIPIYEAREMILSMAKHILQELYLAQR